MLKNAVDLVTAPFPKVGWMPEHGAAILNCKPSPLVPIRAVLLRKPTEVSNTVMLTANETLRQIDAGLLLRALQPGA